MLQFSEEKKRHLGKRLSEIHSAALAFSGGADSSFLLAKMKHACRGKIVAISAVCAFVPAEDILRAEKFAADLGVQHMKVKVDILANSDVVQNTHRRCFHCKLAMFSKIRDVAAEEGIECLLHGVNQDDLSDFRPGLEAAAALGFVSPLAEVGMVKAEIRTLSKRMGLSSWDLPSQSCLATRIAYHEPITQKKLSMIQTAEKIFQAEGFDVVRVRCHGMNATVEVAPERVAEAAQLFKQRTLVTRLKKIGFQRVVLDSQGYRTGKMNDEIFTGRGRPDICTPS